MNPFCVFCGKEPQKKTKEHILPLWLLSLTGDPCRVVYLGFNFSRPQVDLWRFSYNSFHFPSCEACNGRFSDLESSAKSVIVRMLDYQALTESDFLTLLDWLDKVRVGLWVAFIYLNKNHAKIEPNFYIADRVAKEDRYVAIYQTDCAQSALAFCGVNGPIFETLPCCFTLIVNNLMLFNVSYPFVVSRRLGFPYPGTYAICDELGKLEYDIRSGCRRLLCPILPLKTVFEEVGIAQPIFSRIAGVPTVQQYYRTKYVTENCLRDRQGYGHLFIEGTHSIDRYPSGDTKAWIPKTFYETDL